MVYNKVVESHVQNTYVYLVISPVGILKWLRLTRFVCPTLWRDFSLLLIVFGRRTTLQHFRIRIGFVKLTRYKVHCFRAEIEFD